MKKKNVLLVIDLQKEFYVKDKYEKVLAFVKDSREKYDEIFATMFINCKNDSNFIQKLNWNGCKNANFNSVEFEWDSFFSKDTYSIPPDILDKNMHYDIVGCDADACILASAFALFDAGYDFSILSEYIYTSSTEFNEDIAFQIMKRNFGKCVR